MTTPLSAGQRTVIHARDKYDLTFRNDVGGTEGAPAGRYEVIVDRVWWDYEIGWRAAGHLVNDTDIATLRGLGETPYKPKVRKWRPDEVFFEGEGR